MSKSKKIVRNIIFVGLGIAMLIAFIILGNQDWEKDKVSRTTNFNTEYTSVPKENLFVYKTADEIINILENKTGIVYLGFPECPWCQAYAPYLNEIATEVGIEEIYYYNIKSIRESNSLKYQKMVTILNNYLNSDDAGNKKIFVPEVIFVKDGTIIGHNNETSMNSGDPNEYWTQENQTRLKDTLKSLCIQVKNCSTCN